jgi:hypothetical protein
VWPTYHTNVHLTNHLQTPDNWIICALANMQPNIYSSPRSAHTLLTHPAPSHFYIPITSKTPSPLAPSSMTRRASFSHLQPHSCPYPPSHLVSQPTPLSLHHPQPSPLSAETSHSNNADLEDVLTPRAQRRDQRSGLETRWRRNARRPSERRSQWWRRSARCVWGRQVGC